MLGLASNKPGDSKGKRQGSLFQFVGIHASLNAVELFCANLFFRRSNQIVNHQSSIVNH
jgi:hypothetical protein